MSKYLVGLLSLLVVVPTFGHSLAQNPSSPATYSEPFVQDVDERVAAGSEGEITPDIFAMAMPMSSMDSLPGSATGVFSSSRDLLTEETGGSVEATEVSTRFSNPKPEKFHWRAALMESFLFLSYQQGGNIGLSEWIRHSLTHPDWKYPNGTWFGNYEKSLEGYRWTVWNDNDPFLDDYIAHPMMGAITGYIQIQNDPQGRALEIGNSKRYWKSRAKAFAWSAIYSAQWKLGPISETSIGNIGEATYYSTASHGTSNGTGMIDLVMTPVGGAVWGMGEDLIDKYMIKRLERVSHKKIWLLAISILNPSRSGANLLRFRAPYYRDSRNTSVPEIR